MSDMIDVMIDGKLTRVCLADVADALVQRYPSGYRMSIEYQRGERIVRFEVEDDRTPGPVG